MQKLEPRTVGLKHTKIGPVDWVICSFVSLKALEVLKFIFSEWWNEEFKCHVSLVHLKSRLLSPKPNLLRLSTPSSARNAKTRMLSSHDHNSTYIKKANVAWSERVKHGAGTAFEKNGASTVFYLSGATSRHLKNEKKNAVAFNTPSAEDVFPRAEYKKFDEVIISPVIDSWGAIVAVAEQPKASQTPRYSKTDPHSVVLSLPHRNNQQEEVKKMCKNSEREGISNTISQIYPVSQPIETQPMDLHVKVTKADEIDSISSDPVNIFFTKSNSVIAADKKEASFHAFKTKSNEPKTFELTFTKASDNTSNSKAAEENQTLDLLSESLSHQADKMLISDSNLFATSSKKPTVITQPLSLLQSNTSYKSSTTFISSKRKSKTDLQANLEEPSGDENRYCCQTCSCRFSSRVNLQVASKSASCCYACCLSRTKTQITSTGHSLSSCCFSSRSCSTTCGSAMPCCKPCETEFFSCYNSCCTYGKYSSSSLRSCWVDFSRLFVGSLRTFSHFIKCGCINVGGSNSPSSSARVPVANCSCYSCLSCCAPSRIDESVFPNNVTKKI